MKKINNILKWAFSECGLRKIEAVTTIITAVAGIAITVAGIIITMKVANIQNELSLKNSTFILRDNVDVELASKECTISFFIEQGGIQKIYTAEQGINSIVFEEENNKIIEDKKNNKCIRITKKLTEAETEQEMTMDENVKKIYSQLDIKDIRTFAILILDTTNKWNIYYCIVQPEINPKNLSYSLALYQKNELIGENEKQLDIKKGKSVIIPGEIVNVETIEKMISDEGFKTNDKYYFFTEDMKIKGKHGEEVLSNPCIDIAYSVPTANEIYDDFKEIHDTIQQFDI